MARIKSAFVGPLVYDTPSSWYILMALSGVWYDGITHSLTIKPRPWSKMGELEKVPVFHPLFWATVSTEGSKWTVEITQLRTESLQISELLCDGLVALSVDGSPIDLSTSDGETGRSTCDFAITKPVTLVGQMR